MSSPNKYYGSYNQGDRMLTQYGKIFIELKVLGVNLEGDAR